ncbi:MAG: tRNA pseudouridine(38-40) synthase TruA [Holosporales bacterium]|jgi:tRNA pseudouridine38-40 synthase|nr:tRNA pseudouridine(38-40) synthase TruA [Holosporales bacterium]
MRIKIIIEYDGTGFAGWQRQDNSNNTVQETLEKAIEKVFDYRERITLYGAGRTDAGVHATGQVAHFDILSDLLVERWMRNAHKLVRAVNFYLIETGVVVLGADIVPDDFHARFSAKMRHYEYIILNRETSSVIVARHSWHVSKTLDILPMRKAAEYFVGKHNLSAFRSAECSANNTERNISSVVVDKIGQLITISVSARSFLHNQVRIMVGTLRMIGAGEKEPEIIPVLLESGDRRNAGPTAPACGLYLRRIDYESP